MANPLSKVSADGNARARKTIGLLLKRAQAATNRRIAADMGIEESTLSRWRDDHLARAVDFILATGCKVVPADLICMEKRRLEALQYYADVGMAAEKEAPQKLVADWED
jgi:hypothetical protein